jgi:hypothetical protein
MAVNVGAEAPTPGAKHLLVGCSELFCALKDTVEGGAVQEFPVQDYGADFLGVVDVIEGIGVE